MAQPGKHRVTRNWHALISFTSYYRRVGKHRVTWNRHDLFKSYHAVLPVPDIYNILNIDITVGTVQTYLWYGNQCDK